MRSGLTISSAMPRRDVVSGAAHLRRQGRGRDAPRLVHSRSEIGRRSRNLRPSLSYLICCCERTGSTLLGDALIGTGIAGQPHGYFSRVALHNPRTPSNFGEIKDDDDYLDKVIAAATTPNGVFGAKVHWDHFMTLIAKAERRARAQPGGGSGAGARAPAVVLFPTSATSGSRARMRLHARSRIIVSRRPIDGSSIRDG